MKVYTIKQVAEVLSVCTRTVYDLINTGELKAVKVGNKWRVKEQWLDEMLSNRLEASA